MDYLLVIGIALIIIGVILLVTGARSSKCAQVSATGGSVAIGGKNAGPIQNINIGTGTHKNAGHSSTLTIVGIIVELVGIGITVWHIYARL